MIDPTMMGGGAPPPSVQIGGGGQSAPSDSGGGDPVEMLRQALELVRKAAVAEQDDEEQARIEKIGTAIADAIAQDQKLQDAMMGTSPAHKGLRRQMQKGQ